jgi:hypothetical protein
MPPYILEAGRGIIPHMVRFHLQPTEQNRDTVDMLLSQLNDMLKLKIKEKELEAKGVDVGTDEEDTFGMFVV